jgi:hypothetical protein
VKEKLRYPLLAASTVAVMMTFSQVGSAQPSRSVGMTTDRPAPGPQNVAPSATPGVPASTCRPGFTQQGFWLCMTGARGAAQYDNAVVYCQDAGGRVADVNDWRYRIFRGDGVSAPVNWWFGPRTGDDTALFANSSNAGNPDGEASVFDSRNYACAHDLIR